jgi:hypothetical protein|tara:strand:+ start:258 stop:452 length:195 start_codon:yes stop_codon:yes gene_type:complete
MILTAIYNTLISMGPYYMTNTYKWFRCALWDAPKRFMLDVELEKIAIELNLSREEKELSSSDSY